MTYRNSCWMLIVILPLDPAFVWLTQCLWIYLKLRLRFHALPALSVNRFADWFQLISFNWNRFSRAHFNCTKLKANASWFIVGFVCFGGGEGCKYDCSKAVHCLNFKLQNFPLISSCVNYFHRTFTGRKFTAFIGKSFLRQTLRALLCKA